MQRARYEIDPHNRLIVTEDGRDSSLPRQRRVLDGKFSVGADNSLIYNVKSPIDDRTAAPHNIRLRGNWSLDSGHNLKFTFENWRRKGGSDDISIDGEILDVRKDSILFGVKTGKAGGGRTTYALELTGSWQADNRNRLTFRVRREKGAGDILTFDGIWSVDNNNEITYSYRRSAPRRRTKVLRTLVFKGHWDIADRTKITYSLGAGSDSRFDLRTGIARTEKDYIKYEIGIGLSKRPKPVKERISIYGRWRIGRDTGLIFDVAYSGKNNYAISFGAEASLTDKDVIAFKLSKEDGKKDLAMTLELSHKMLKGDGESFVRLLRSKEESAVYVGAGFRW